MNTAVQSQRLLADARKRFWILWLPLSFAGLTAIILAFILLQKVEVERLDSSISASVTLAEHQIHHDFFKVYSDLEFITNSPITRDLAEAPQSISKRDSLESIFITLASTHKIYDQIRLLSNTGKELVRVNYRQNSAQATPVPELQDKANRYYFQAASKLKPGGIYVSQFDLNVENNQLEQPLKPMIRFASGIHDTQGNLQGVIVLNYLGDMLLDNFRSHMSSIPGDRMLVNSDGYWLSNDIRAKEWGFMLETNNTFQLEYPKLWPQIQQNEQGVIDAEIGRVIYSSVDTLADKSSIRSNSLQPWKIIVINKEHQMGLSFIYKHLSYLYPLLLAYPLGSILLWYFAKASSGRRLAESDLKTLNHSLEETIKHRTSELKATKDATILSLATLAETRDNETGQHIRRTQNYVKLLAENLQQHPDFSKQLSDTAIEELYKSAPLHDIGKVGVPDAILLKPARLSVDEFEIMKRHTVHGQNALQEAINSLAAGEASTFLHYARDIAHYHHERWDGNGYPEGLSGNAIPLAARIMAVADVYDALVSTRVYKKAFSKDEAEQIILQKSSGQFDPRILNAFDELKDQFWEIKSQFED